MKKCSRCKEEKEKNEFAVRKESASGHVSHCKQCCREKYFLNKEKIIEGQKKYAEKNKEKIKAYRQKYYSRPEIKKKRIQDDKKYREENKEKFANHKRLWYQKNKNNPIYKIKNNLRRRLNHVIKNNLKADKTLSLLGCTAEELKIHLESLFQPGMTWENYGKFGWHIDHLKPCDSFDLSNPEEQRKCFHFSNLQPLWWRDNIIKSNNL